MSLEVEGRSQCDAASEARLRALLPLRRPARDDAGLIREATELWDELHQECESRDDAPCSLLHGFLEFLFELQTGWLNPAGLHGPFQFDLERARLSGRQLVALWTLKRNMWAYPRLGRDTPVSDLELAKSYVRKARSIADAMIAA